MDAAANSLSGAGGTAAGMAGAVAATPGLQAALDAAAADVMSGSMPDIPADVLAASVAQAQAVAAAAFYDSLAEAADTTADGMAQAYGAFSMLQQQAELTIGQAQSFLSNDFDVFAAARQYAAGALQQCGGISPTPAENSFRASVAQLRTESLTATTDADGVASFSISIDEGVLGYYSIQARVRARGVGVRSGRAE